MSDETDGETRMENGAEYKYVRGTNPVMYERDLQVGMGGLKLLQCNEDYIAK